MPDEKNNQGSFDFNAMRERRDDGIERAAGHADQVAGCDWTTCAVESLKKYLAQRSEPFMAADFVAWSLQQGTSPPPDARAWGAPMVVAKKQGLIQRIGFAVDKFGSPKPVWQGRLLGSGS